MSQPAPPEPQGAARARAGRGASGRAATLAPLRTAGGSGAQTKESPPHRGASSESNRAGRPQGLCPRTSVPPFKNKPALIPALPPDGHPRAKPPRPGPPARPRPSPFSPVADPAGAASDYVCPTDESASLQVTVSCTDLPGFILPCLPDHVIRLTLDTGCIIHVVQRTGCWQEVEQLAAFAQKGHCQLFLTSGFEADQRRASDANNRSNLKWISATPILRAPGPFRFDLSNFDGDDVLTTRQVAGTDEVIKQILRPSHVKGAAFPDRKVNDVHHLTAHYMANNQYFVTVDSDDILRRASELKDRVGLMVIEPKHAVTVIKDHLYTLHTPIHGR